MTMNVAVCRVGLVGQADRQLASPRPSGSKVVAAFDPMPPADAPQLAKAHGFKICRPYQAVLADKAVEPA